MASDLWRRKPCLQRRMQRWLAHSKSVKPEKPATRNILDLSRVDLMNYIEAPEQYAPTAGQRSLFLAGGITGCPDWQRTMVDLLADTSLALLNPRRARFPIDDPARPMRRSPGSTSTCARATAILFWFPHETLNPIVLYELGAWSMTDKPLFVGVHPQYQRRPRCRDPDAPGAAGCAGGAFAGGACKGCQRHQPGCDKIVLL